MTLALLACSLYAQTAVTEVSTSTQNGTIRQRLPTDNSSASQLVDNGLSADNILTIKEYYRLFTRRGNHFLTLHVPALNILHSSYVPRSGAPVSQLLDCGVSGMGIGYEYFVADNQSIELGVDALPASYIPMPFLCLAAMESMELSINAAYRYHLPRVTFGAGISESLLFNRQSQLTDETSDKEWAMQNCASSLGILASCHARTGARTEMGVTAYWKPFVVSDSRTFFAPTDYLLSFDVRWRINLGKSIASQMTRYTSLGRTPREKMALEATFEQIGIQNIRAQFPEAKDISPMGLRNQAGQTYLVVNIPVVHTLSMHPDMLDRSVNSGGNFSIGLGVEHFYRHNRSWTIAIDRLAPLFSAYDDTSLTVRQINLSASANLYGHDFGFSAGANLSYNRWDYDSWVLVRNEKYNFGIDDIHYRSVGAGLVLGARLLLGPVCSAGITYRPTLAGSPSRRMYYDYSLSLDVKFNINLGRRNNKNKYFTTFLKQNTGIAQ